MAGLGCLMKSHSSGMIPAPDKPGNDALQPDRGRARPICEREVKLAADVGQAAYVSWSSQAQIVST